MYASFKCATSSSAGLVSEHGRISFRPYHRRFQRTRPRAGAGMCRAGGPAAPVRPRRGAAGSGGCGLPGARGGGGGAGAGRLRRRRRWRHGSPRRVGLTGGGERRHFRRHRRRAAGEGRADPGGFRDQPGRGAEHGTAGAGGDAWPGAGGDGVRGRIAVVASIAAFVAGPGAPAYCASKAAVDAWTVATAVTARREGVLMTSICPGYVRTAMTARNRFPDAGTDGRRSRRADHAARHCGGAAADCVSLVDGGLTARLPGCCRPRLVGARLSLPPGKEGLPDQS